VVTDSTSQTAKAGARRKPAWLSGSVGCRAAPEVLSSGTAALRGQMPTRMTGPKKRARPAAVGRLAPPAELAEAETKKPFIEVRSKQGRFETSTPGRRFDRRALEAALSRKGKVQTRPFSDTHAPSGGPDGRIRTAPPSIRGGVQKPVFCETRAIYASGARVSSWRPPPARSVVKARPPRWPRRAARSVASDPDSNLNRP
jgi:hypothetical protein